MLFWSFAFLSLLFLKFTSPLFNFLLFPSSLSYAQNPHNENSLAIIVRILRFSTYKGFEVSLRNLISLLRFYFTLPRHVLSIFCPKKSLFVAITFIFVLVLVLFSTKKEMPTGILFLGGILQSYFFILLFNLHQKEDFLYQYIVV